MAEWVGWIEGDDMAEWVGWLVCGLKHCRLADSRF